MLDSRIFKSQRTCECAGTSVNCVCKQCQLRDARNNTITDAILNKNIPPLRPQECANIKQ